jgi:hypothetical protein
MHSVLSRHDGRLRGRNSGMRQDQRLVPGGAAQGQGGRLPCRRVRGPGELRACRRDPGTGPPSSHRSRRIRARPVLRGGRGRPADLGEAGLSSSGLGLLQLIEWAQSTAVLHEAGFTVIWQAQCAATHHATAAVPLQSVRADPATIARQIGTQAVAELITAHQLWSAWLSSRGVRTFVMVVAEKR